MKLLQWIYTSCCWNIEGNFGYKTFSHSEGLEPGEVRELVDFFGRYERPADVSMQPDDEEIKTRCPVLFYSVTLSTGRKAICRVNYLGHNWYDGRWGNFIAHALILQARSKPVSGNLGRPENGGIFGVCNFLYFTKVAKSEF